MYICYIFVVYAAKNFTVAAITKFRARGATGGTYGLQKSKVRRNDFRCGEKAVHVTAAVVKSNV